MNPKIAKVLRAAMRLGKYRFCGVRRVWRPEWDATLVERLDKAIKIAALANNGR